MNPMAEWIQINVSTLCFNKNDSPVCENFLYPTQRLTQQPAQHQHNIQHNTQHNTQHNIQHNT